MFNAVVSSEERLVAFGCECTVPMLAEGHSNLVNPLEGTSGASHCRELSLTVGASHCRELLTVWIREFLIVGSFKRRSISCQCCWLRVTANEVNPTESMFTTVVRNEECLMSVGCAEVVSNEDCRCLASAVSCKSLPLKSTQIDPCSTQL